MLVPYKKKNKTGRDFKANLISGKGKLIMLIIFCLLFGSISFFIAKRSFSAKQEISFSAGSIEKPKHIYQNGGASRTHGSITREEYLRIQNFKQYMDSLAISPLGRHIFDSITKARPGLLDSMLTIENIYHSQTNSLYNGTTNP